METMLHDLWMDRQKEVRSKEKASSSAELGFQSASDQRSHTNRIERVEILEDVADDHVRPDMRTVVLPAFDGSTPVYWIAVVEQYCEVQRVREESKVALASTYLHGCTIYWYKMIRCKYPQLDWESMKLELLIQYCSYGDEFSGDLSDQFSGERKDKVQADSEVITDISSQATSVCQQVDCSVINRPSAGSNECASGVRHNVLVGDTTAAQYGGHRGTFGDGLSNCNNVSSACKDVPINSEVVIYSKEAHSNLSDVNSSLVLVKCDGHQGAAETVDQLKQEILLENVGCNVPVTSSEIYPRPQICFQLETVSHGLIFSCEDFLLPHDQSPYLVSNFLPVNDGDIVNFVVNVHCGAILNERAVRALTCEGTSYPCDQHLRCFIGCVWQ